MPGMDPSRLLLEVESTAEYGSQSSVLSAHADSSTASTTTHEASVLGCCSSQCPHLLQDCTAY